MKSFHYASGRLACITMTVGELIEKLREYPEDMPVFAAWESSEHYIDPDNFEVRRVTSGMEEDACDCVVIDVNNY